MPRYPARRLLEVRQRMNEPPDEEALRALLDALLGALLAFHQAGGVHGKVTPSNILLLDDNRPLLLGPGAAGRAIASDRIDALMTSAEPCFAPIEQIVEPDIPLGPSVDLYALAGVARYWMSGSCPRQPSARPAPHGEKNSPIQCNGCASRGRGCTTAHPCWTRSTAPCQSIPLSGRKVSRRCARA